MLIIAFFLFNDLANFLPYYDKIIVISTKVSACKFSGSNKTLRPSRKIKFVLREMGVFFYPSQNRSDLRCPFGPLASIQMAVRAGN